MRNHRPPLTRQDLLKYMRSHRYAVQASVSAAGSPQAAIIGIAVSDSFEIIFDTLVSTRKATNLLENPRIALVIGGWVTGDERTVQYEGILDRPDGLELEKLKQIYYTAFPDGPARLGWPGLVYLRARPTWIRYSDFNADPPEILELDSRQITTLT